MLSPLPADLCSRAISTCVSSPTACDSLSYTIHDDATQSHRPTLKRQATAPATALANHIAKKLCEDNKKLGKAWTSDVHAAFLEALHHHPSNSSWQAKSFAGCSFDDQTDYCTIIQDYILRKTGRPQNVDEIHNRLHEAFNDLQVSSPVDHPPSPIDTSQKRSDFMSQLLMNDLSGHLDDKLLLELDAHKINSTSSSMSRRREACNRPTLKLHVQIPATQSEKSNLCSGTPLTASFLASKFLSTMDGCVSPHTPVEKGMYIPIGPPEIPRMIDMRHAMVGRWMPTPTEGVLPEVPTLSSPDVAPSVLSTDSDGSGSNYSSVTDVPGKDTLRPKLGARATSWLSVHASGILSSDTLSSPFATPFPPTSPN